MVQYLGQRQKKSGRSVSRLITDHCFLITALAPALTSCMGVYEGGFECPPGTGVGCKSISAINQMIDQCSSGAVVQNSECRVPEFHHQDSEMGVTESDSYTSQIWYAPSSSIQCSVSSIQCPGEPLGGFSDAEGDFPNKEKREKAHAQDSI